jgi:hypothetical protein
MKSPFSRADRAWRAVALLQQAARQRDTRGSAVEPVAHTLSAPWAGIAARAGGLIGAHAAGGRGRGAQKEPTAGTSRAPRRVRIPHLSRSTSVCQRCMHSNDASIYYLCVGLFGGGIAECHSTATVLGVSRTTLQRRAPHSRARASNPTKDGCLITLSVGSQESNKRKTAAACLRS